MIGRTNASGGGLTKSTLVVQTESGSTVTAAKGSEVRTAGERFGVWAFPGLAAGSWTVKAVKDGKTATKVVAMDGTASVMVTLEFNAVPAFTYTGEYELVDDNDNPINATTGNWKIRFLTSGTLKFTALRGAENGIDVFLVGGGGSPYSKADSGWAKPGGAGSGYTKTSRNISIDQGIEYTITIGAGGAGAATSGGCTSAFGLSAQGGKTGLSNGTGGDGGSGGGGGGYLNHNGVDATGWTNPGNGGTDGANGEKGYYSGGNGQGTTTREFGDGAGKRYAAGGVGGGGSDGHGKKRGTVDVPLENSGCDTYAGIVIIRNKR